jgi:hypothetical protein
VSVGFTRSDVIFSLTQKARDLHGRAPRLYAAPPANDPPPFLGWYVNVLHIERRKCLLVMEAATFYSVVIPGILKADMIDLGGLVRHHLAEVLAADGFSEDEAALVLGSGPDTYVKAGSKRVLGCMVEQAFMAESYVEHSGGLAAVTGVEVSLALNQAILMPLKPYYCPGEAMRAAVVTRVR